MKKLELRHIAPYLPYELQFKDPETIAPGVMVSIVTGMVGLLLYENTDNIEYYELSDIKPLLIPLSELNNIIPTINSECTPYQILQSRFNYPTLRSFQYNFIYGDVEVDMGSTMQVIGYSIFQQLFEWHIDAFGLIDAGLALNKQEVL